MSNDTNQTVLFWGPGWRGVPEFLDESWRQETDLLIGCVDTRKARNMMTRTEAYWNSYYWLDLGNNADTGQFVLGQPENGRNKNCDRRLPTVADRFPEIVNPKLNKKDSLPSCSAIEALERQEPFVNQALAYQGLAMLTRLFRYGASRITADSRPKRNLSNSSIGYRGIRKTFLSSDHFINGADTCDRHFIDKIRVVFDEKFRNGTAWKGSVDARFTAEVIGIAAGDVLLLAASAREDPWNCLMNMVPSLAKLGSRARSRCRHCRRMASTWKLRFAMSRDLINCWLTRSSVTIITVMNLS